MKSGYLSDYFEGVAMKRLSAVEADAGRSNQHEYNATKDMLAFLGKPEGRQALDTRFLYLSDEDSEPVAEDSFMTLYDSRERHPTRSEYRIYYPSTEVSARASEGDLLTIAKASNGKYLAITAQQGSSIARQLAWLFGLDDQRDAFVARVDLDKERDRIGFAATLILESIGIVVRQGDAEYYLDMMLGRFGGKFPASKEFSAYARETAQVVDAKDDPDLALMRWMEHEELLFRTLERHIVEQRLAQGFTVDQIDEFHSFSLSVQNRRKVRVGLAMENHISMVLDAHGVSYTRTAVTENKSKPDFLFPGRKAYHDPMFEESRLTMLASKSTCKDRWRQVLAEADRIARKHLLTMEPSISVAQTDEMRTKLLQLVVPRPLHGTYLPAQQSWLRDFRAFIELVKQRQG